MLHRVVSSYYNYLGTYLSSSDTFRAGLQSKARRIRKMVVLLFVLSRDGSLSALDLI